MFVRFIVFLILWFFITACSESQGKQNENKIKTDTLSVIKTDTF
jgi:hypothetical protein